MSPVLLVSEILSKFENCKRLLGNALNDGNFNRRFPLWTTEFAAIRSTAGLVRRLLDTHACLQAAPHEYWTGLVNASTVEYDSHISHIFVCCCYLFVRRWSRESWAFTHSVCRLSSAWLELLPTSSVRWTRNTTSCWRRCSSRRTSSSASIQSILPPAATTCAVNTLPVLRAFFLLTYVHIRTGCRHNLTVSQGNNQQVY